MWRNKLPAKFIYWLMMQPNVIENLFNRKYASLATIQPGVAIKLTINGANDLYLDLNNSRLQLLAKISKADGANIDANTATPINLTYHSMFREIEMELTKWKISNTRQMYQ